MAIGRHALGSFAALALFAQVALVASGCGEDRSALEVTEVAPPWGPMLGGSRIAIHGHGFAAARDALVLVDGRPAPLVATIDDDTLDVVTPPGLRPGPVAVEVVVGIHAARLDDGFRYSRPPTIVAVSPAEVPYTRFETITVHGSGFTEEGAGDPVLLVDGRQVGVTVTSDTELSFVAPPGVPLREPELELVNQRGEVLFPRAFRYLPGTRAGLLLFADAQFATFYDPVDGSSVAIPWVTSPDARLTAVVTDDHGDLWGFDRNRRLGRLDLSEQRLDGPTPLGRWVPAMARVGDQVIAIDRSLRRLSRLDLATGVLTPFTTPLLPCCGSYGLASDGTKLYLAARDGGALTIRTVDADTGELGPSVPLTGPPGLHLEDMRFFAGVLYAISRDGTLVTIEPTTGEVTVLPLVIARGHAIEIYQP